MADGPSPAPSEASSEVPDDVAARVLSRARAAVVEDRPHTFSEVAAAADLPSDVVRRLFAAAQRLTADEAYGEVDLAYAQDLATMVARSDVEAVEQALRLRLRLITQMVVNDLSAIRLDSTLAALLEQGVAPEALGAQLGVLAAEVVPAVERQLGADYRAVLLRLLDSDVVSQVTGDVERLPTMAVGFVDLVGFTRLSAQIDPQGVRTVLSAFEGLAAREVERADRVLLAKTIGDAVMLVGGDPDQVCAALLGIVEARPAGLEDIDRRAGMAYGEVLVREGDYVGTTANTAARLTDLARPGTVIVSPEAAAALTDGWETSRLPPRTLKGLGKVRAVRIRRAPAPAP